MARKTSSKRGRRLFLDLFFFELGCLDANKAAVTVILSNISAGCLLCVMRIVLAGGGHVHQQLLLAGKSLLETGRVVQMTLVSNSELSPYSGMWPGLVAGKYKVGEATVSLPRIAAEHGWHFELGSVVGVDCDKRLVLCTRHDGTPFSIPYDLLSLNVGSRTRDIPETVSPKHSLATRPILDLGTNLVEISDRFIPHSSVRVVVVGAGAAGVELAMAVTQHLKQKGHDVVVSIVDSHDTLLPSESSALREEVLAQLHKRHISTYFGAVITHVEEQKLNFRIKDASPDHLLEFDLIIWATGAAPHVVHFPYQMEHKT